MSPDDPRHGTPAGGRVHRRDAETVCASCLRAEARYQNELQLDHMRGIRREIDSTGTRRRIQALVTIGHSMTHIANALGISGQAVWNMANRPTAYTRQTTAAKIADLYDAWSMRLPDQSTGKARKAAAYAQTVARKKNWAPPLAWDNIDDPNEQPNLGAPDPRNHNGTRPLELMIEDAEWLADNDANLTEVLDRLDVNRDTFRDLLRRADRTDLYWRLAMREPDADNRKATRDGIRRNREVA